MEKESCLKRYLEANTSVMQSILWKELEHKVREIEELEKYIRKLKESQTLVYLEIEKWEKLKEDQTFFVVKKDWEVGYMYKNTEDGILDEESMRKHQEMVEKQRRENFINEKVKQWSDFLFNVEDIIQNFSSFSVQKQADIMHFIFEGIVLKN